MAKVSTLVFAVLIVATVARGQSGRNFDPLVSTGGVGGFSRDLAGRSPIEWAAVVDGCESVEVMRESEPPAFGLIGIGISGLIALRRFRKFFS